MYSASYKDNVPSWEDFKSNKTHISSGGFSCVGCVDIRDQKRVMLISFENNLMYNCYGDYEGEAKAAFDDILSIYSTLK